MGAEIVQRKILCYDIGCQYCVNLLYCWTKEFPNVSLDGLKILIGKMHLQNHVENCQWLYSLNYTEGVGRLDGEEVERFWAEMNQVAGSTKQMNPGHRRDTLDDIIRDWNKGKLVNMGEFSLRCVEFELMYI